MAAASILVGGIGAVSQNDLDGLLAYSSIGQIGFVALPLAVGATVSQVRPLAIAAALVYALNHGVAKSLLFLVSGTIEDSVGSVRFRELGGIAARNPVLAGSFLLGALALIGIPPLSGFFAKLLVFDTSGEALAVGGRGASLALGVALLGAILTVAYFSRAWARGFWGPPGRVIETWGASERGDDSRAESTAADGGTTERTDGGVGGSIETGPSLALVSIVAVLALALVVIGVGFDPVMDAAMNAAESALDREAYVRAVLGGGGG